MLCSTFMTPTASGLHAPSIGLGSNLPLQVKGGKCFLVLDIKNLCRELQRANIFTTILCKLLKWEEGPFLKEVNCYCKPIPTSLEVSPIGQDPVVETIASPTPLCPLPVQFFPPTCPSEKHTPLVVVFLLPTSSIWVLLGLRQANGGSALQHFCDSSTLVTIGLGPCSPKYFGLSS